MGAVHPGNAARARVVLQQPGGPTIMIPRGGLKPKRWNAATEQER